MTKIFCLVGPTGVGKTEIAVELAQKYNLEIISADSRQIYKYLDIGTAKSYFKINMIDIITPDILYSAADFARDCKKVIDRLTQQKKEFILVGGSGLYLKALFEPFFESAPRNLMLRKILEKEPIEKMYNNLKIIDPISAERIKPHDRQRIIRALELYETTRKPLSEQLKQKHPKSEFIPYYVGLTMPRKILHEKINNRFEQMIEDGLVDEVKRLLKIGYTKEDNALNGIGYQEIIRFLDGKLSLMQAIQIAKTRSRQYAKRQMTWFNKVEGIRWVEYTTSGETVSKINQEYKAYLNKI